MESLLATIIALLISMFVSYYANSMGCAGCLVFFIIFLIAFYLLTAIPNVL